MYTEQAKGKSVKQDSNMRLAKAQESLQAAENCLALGLMNSCASRCYYAMFQAAVVALATAGFHRDTWSHPPFRQRLLPS